MGLVSQWLCHRVWASFISINVNRRLISGGKTGPWCLMHVRAQGLSKVDRCLCVV